MKKISIILLSVIILGACSDFLELNESVYQTKDYQFSEFNRVKNVVTGVYGYVTDGLSDVEGTMLDVASDDAVYAWNTHSIRKFYDGSWSPINLIDNQWPYYYSAIRAANYFLENCPDDFPASIYLDDYKERMVELRNFPYEVRALRAYFHFNLLKRYNQIVIADRTYTPEEANELQPVSYQEAAEWIVAECDSVSLHLPLNYKNTPSAELGRVTRGMVMALKARVLLYAASPLNNTQNLSTLWLNAAIAAKDVIELGEYELIPEDVTNNEIASGLIFGKRSPSSNSFEKENFAIGLYMEEGNSGVCPSQNLVESFEMIDGTPFDWSNRDHLRKMMNPLERDPRFAKTVLYNGSRFKNHIIESYKNGKNGFPKEGASPTSYYLKKHIREETSLVAGNESSYSHVFPLFRYAEVLLNYAESLVEATGDPDFKGVQNGVDFTLSPREAVNLVRNRANMPSLPSMDKTQFVERLRNERRVELAFEGHRFWDIRRWKMGEESTTIYGLNITNNFDGTFTYDRIVVQDRVWDDKMYFYPIPASEIFKNNALIQNEGWN